jgi:CubicO group peptidase (beta-lactamase class C family)
VRLHAAAALLPNALAAAALLASAAPARATMPGASVAHPCPDDRSFPGADWPAGELAPRPGSPRAEAIAALDAYAFTLAEPDAARRGIRTDGLLVIHRGVVTYERYGRGFGPATRHLAWSVSKSVTAALAGAAVQAGDVAPDDSICAYLETAPRRHCQITVHHLLEWCSGLDWTESYEHRTHQASSVLAMLYGVGRADMAAFVLGHDVRTAPGVQWAYSSGDSVVLAAVLGAAVGARLGREWPWPLLLDRLGMASAVFERDAAGTYVGSSHFYATPRDLARVGWLYLNDGCWAGERILPHGWVAATTTIAGALRAGSPFRSPGDVTGWGWWLNRPLPEVGEAAPPWPGVPEDAFFAQGHWGQLVVVIPSLELVIVRTGDDREPGALSHARLVRLAIAAGRVP